jgi:hypothetical protein
MDAMYAAIKKRKSGGQSLQGDHQDMSHDSQHADDAQKDLHGLVASLQPHEKEALKNILDKDKDVSQEIQKGGPSTDERGEIESSVQDENQKNALEAQEDGPKVDSDEIGKSMLDSRFTGNGPMPKPRNLGERAKVHIAQNLKHKGKL